MEGGDPARVRLLGDPISDENPGGRGACKIFARPPVTERGGSFVRLIGLNSRGAKRSAFGYLQNRSEAVKVRSIPDGAGP
jgi:hypothetical protein